MICDFCAALSGRFDANLECCQIRQLAGSPAASRRAYFDRLQATSGVEAVAEIKIKMNAEWRRQLAVREAAARVQIERETAKGRAEAAALLKILKDSNMSASPVKAVA